MGSSCTALASIRAIGDHHSAVGAVATYASDARGASDAAIATSAVDARGRGTARATLTAIACRAAITTTATAVTGAW